MKERDRDRQRDRDRLRQTDREDRETETDRQTDRQTKRLTETSNIICWGKNYYLRKKTNKFTRTDQRKKEEKNGKKRKYHTENLMTAFVAALLFVTFINFMQALMRPKRKLQIALTPNRIIQTHKTKFGSQRSEEEKSRQMATSTRFSTEYNIIMCSLTLRKNKL